MENAGGHGAVGWESRILEGLEGLEGAAGLEGGGGKRWRWRRRGALEIRTKAKLAMTMAGAKGSKRSHGGEGCSMSMAQPSVNSMARHA